MSSKRVEKKYEVIGGKYIYFTLLEFDFEKLCFQNIYV
jgi:hypothetical protein